MKTIFFGIGILLIFAIGCVGFLRYTSSQVSSKAVAASAAIPTIVASSTDGTTTPSAPPLTDTSLKAHRVPPSGDSEYYDVNYRFSLFYPRSLQTTVYNEGGGAQTVTFQSDQSAEGFQVYVVPYSEQNVSADQFHKDEPSGVMQSPLNITIDGVSATSFYSTDATLGDTAEIWFIHNGYLFEVTTVKSLAPWLSQIMRSWEFL